MSRESEHDANLSLQRQHTYLRDRPRRRQRKELFPMGPVVIIIWAVLAGAFLPTYTARDLSLWVASCLR